MIQLALLSFFGSIFGIIGTIGHRIYLIKQSARIERELDRHARLAELTELAKKKEEAEQTRNEGKPPVDAEVDHHKIGELLRRSEMHLAKKSYEEAEKILIQILAIKENHIEANEKLALLYLQQKSYRKSENLYRKLAELRPKDPAVFTNLGLALFSENEYEEALACYQQALKLDPKHPMRHSNIGQVYFVLRDFENAVSHFKLAIKGSPRNVEFHFMLADTYREAQAYEKAKSAYEEILEIEPYNSEAKEEVARLTAMGY